MFPCRRHQRGEAVAAGTVRPAVVGRAADAVVATDLGDGLLAGLVPDDEAAMVHRPVGQAVDPMFPSTATGESTAVTPE